MTAHVHDAATQGAATDARPPDRIGVTATRPWWLLPGIIGALVAGGLVLGGVVSLSMVLYVGLFGGMMLMHVGGHGHGGHVSAGHATHSGNASETGDANLSRRSPDAQEAESGSAAEPDERADASTGSETNHDDQHSSHGCH